MVSLKTQVRRVLLVITNVEIVPVLLPTVVPVHIQQEKDRLAFVKLLTITQGRMQLVKLAYTHV